MHFHGRYTHVYVAFLMKLNTDISLKQCNGFIVSGYTSTCIWNTVHYIDWPNFAGKIKAGLKLEIWNYFETELYRFKRIL